MWGKVARKRNQIFKEVVELSKGKGYILLDELVDTVLSIDSSMPFSEIEKLYGKLANAGIILKEQDPAITDFVENSDQDIYDKSQLDYEEIYRRTQQIDPTLKEYLDELRIILPPQHREEAALIAHAQAGNTYAQERLSLMYLRVALKVALKYHERFCLPLDELIQEANVGLILALEKAKAESRFSTYFPWWIRQNIRRVSQGFSSIFYNFPAYIKEFLFKIILLKSAHGYSPYEKADRDGALIESIAEELELDQHKAEGYLCLLDPPIAISDENPDFSDGGYFAERMEQRIEREDFRERLEAILSTFTEREQEVIRLRFGFQDGKVCTLEEVGKMLDVTRERVRQIQAKALRKFRHPSRVDQLRVR